MKTRIPTPFGYFSATYENNMLISLTFPTRTAPSPKTFAPKTPIEKQLYIALNAYFAGKLKRFRFNLKLSGTPFQIKVWKALQTIPYGTVTSYKDIAEVIGHPKAVRAVGSACKKNPLPLVIPCHRVIKSDRSLGNFACGQKWKERLIKLEQSKPHC